MDQDGCCDLILIGESWDCLDEGHSKLASGWWVPDKILPLISFNVEDEHQIQYYGCQCDSHNTPFSEMYLYHTGHPAWQWPNPHGPPITGQRGDCTCTTRVDQHYIVAVPDGPAKAILYLYHMGQPMYGSPYHIYHLPILVIHLHIFDM
jgi:hypothetical protein